MLLNFPWLASTLVTHESQDMAAVELMCLKALTGRSLIMAGDTGQSIYGFINPYRRGGLATGEDPDPQSYPFREGPDPEIHQGENPDALADLLAAKARMYVQDLGYDPEAIGILCSRTAHLSMMSQKLACVGLNSAVVLGDGFSFTDRGVVRLSTLH